VLLFRVQKETGSESKVLPKPKTVKLAFISVFIYNPDPSARHQCCTSCTVPETIEHFQLECKTAKWVVW